MKSTFGFLRLISPGLLLAFALAFLTASFSQGFEKFSRFFLDPLFFGLFLGLAARWLMGEKFLFWPGFGLAQDVFVPLGILLYATQVRWNVFSFGALRQFVIPILVAFAVYYFFLILPASHFKLKKQAAILIWASLALLGPISVVLLAPALQTSDEETSLSLILAGAVTCLMLILLPLMAPILSFSGFTLGALSMLLLPLLTPVNPATMGFPDAIQSATFLFAIKVVLLGPIALAIYLPHRSKQRAPERLPLATIVSFIGIGLLFTFLPILNARSADIYPYSRFALTLAVVAVGLSTDLRHLLAGKNKTVAIYIILAAGASLTAFVCESLSLRLH